MEKEFPCQVWLEAMSEFPPGSQKPHLNQAKWLAKTTGTCCMTDSGHVIHQILFVGGQWAKEILSICAKYDGVDHDIVGSFLTNIALLLFQRSCLYLTLIRSLWKKMQWLARFPWSKLFKLVPPSGSSKKACPNGVKSHFANATLCASYKCVYWWSPAIIRA